MPELSLRPALLYDPKELYWPGQDDKPGYLHEPGRDNPPAITGFAFSISALGLLVLSSGLSFVVSLPCAIIGIVVGRRGVKFADEDPAREVPQLRARGLHRGDRHNRSGRSVGRPLRLRRALARTHSTTRE